MGMNKRLFADIERSAYISPCERYRHALGRHWDRDKGFVLFIGINPSTADATKDDPTIRRCMGFAHSWGYGGIEMCNLYDWVRRSPLTCANKLAIAVSDKNDPVLRCRVDQAALVVAAWGKQPWAQPRIDTVFQTIFNDEKRWHCLRLAKDDFPWHPLYIPAATQPIVFW